MTRLPGNHVDLEHISLYLGMAIGFVLSLWVVLCLLLFKTSWRKSGRAPRRGGVSGASRRRGGWPPSGSGLQPPPLLLPRDCESFGMDDGVCVTWRPRRVGRPGGGQGAAEFWGNGDRRRPPAADLLGHFAGPAAVNLG